MRKAVRYDYLPLVVKKANVQELKSAILNVAVSISAQLLRLNFILAIQKQILPNHIPTGTRDVRFSEVHGIRFRKSR